MRVISVARKDQKWVVTLDGRLTASWATNIRDAARLAYSFANERLPYARKLALPRFSAKRTEWPAQ